jgi:hypothetical protein
VHLVDVVVVAALRGDGQEAILDVDVDLRALHTRDV